MELALRRLGDAAAAGLPDPWPGTVHDAARSRGGVLADALDRAVASTDLGLTRTPLWWRVPASARDVRVGGVPVAASPSAPALRLPGRAGELRIAWRVPARTWSFDGVTAALQRAYRARGAKPPR